MFICQIIASRGNGGLEKHVRELSVCLVNQGHRLLVIGDTSFVKTLPDGVTSVGLNMRLSRHNPWLWFQIYQSLKQYPIDVIHAQANKAASLVSKLTRFIKVPIVVTVHNIKNQLTLFHRFNHVICVSQYLANQLKHSGATVIYNGIQSAKAATAIPSLHQAFLLSNNKPVICAVGRLVYAKGFDVLLDAIDGLNISLLIIGEGPERRVLEERIARLDKRTTVRLIGHHHDPTLIMRATEALLISSRREGFSYVLNEALMCDINVLASDVPVANEVLPEQLIVPIGNPLALRHRLKYLLLHKETWATLMQDAKRFAKKEMTVEQMTKKTVDLYERIQKNKNGY